MISRARIKNKVERGVVAKKQKKKKHEEIQKIKNMKSEDVTEYRSTNARVPEEKEELPRDELEAKAVILRVGPALRPRIF